MTDDRPYGLPADRVPTPRSAPMEQERERTMDALQAAFAGEELTLDEFDERMELARTASDTRELAVLLVDVPSQEHVATALVPVREHLPAPPMATSTALVPADAARPQHMYAVFGGVERDGRWTPAPVTKAIALFGGIELDFCDVELAPGSVTVVDCFVAFGSVEVEVPSHVRVEVAGHGFFGGFEERSRYADPAPDAPVVRVVGTAVFGGVEVKVKRPKKRSRWFDRFRRGDRDKRVERDEQRYLER